MPGLLAHFLHQQGTIFSFIAQTALAPTASTCLLSLWSKLFNKFSKIIIYILPNPFCQKCLGHTFKWCFQLNFSDNHNTWSFRSLETLQGLLLTHLQMIICDRKFQKGWVQNVKLRPLGWRASMFGLKNISHTLHISAKSSSFPKGHQPTAGVTAGKREVQSPFVSPGICRSRQGCP